MALDATDWTITRSTKVIDYIGDDHGGASPTYATVLEFIDFIRGLGDDGSSTGDDEYAIADDTVFDRSTDVILTLINGYTVTDAGYEHLYKGSITQDSGDTIHDGVKNFGAPSTQLQIIQDGAVMADDFWNKGLGGTHTAGTSTTVMTDSGASFAVNEFVGFVIYNTTDVSQGVIVSNTSTTVTVDELEGGTDDDWDSSDAYLIGRPINPDVNQGVSHQFVIKVRSNGVDIDQRRLVGTSRIFSKENEEFSINGTSRGENVLALSPGNDLNNTTAPNTVEGWTAITNTEGLRLIDIDNNGVNEEYYSEWNRDVFTINQFYERTKWLTRDGSASTINGLNGELFRGITHSIVWDADAGAAPVTNDELAWGTNLVYDTETSGPFTVGEAIHEDTATPVWKARILAIDDNGTTGSLIVDVETGTITTGDNFTGQSSAAQANTNGTPTVVVGGGVFRAFAVDDDGGAGNLYGQVMKGTAPPDNAILYDDTDIANTLTVAGASTVRTVSTPYIGVSTGTALIGAFGIGMEAADAGASDIFTDLSNATINPPNNVTFSVIGLDITSSEEDRLLLAPANGSNRREDQGDIESGGITSGQATIRVDSGSETLGTGTPSEKDTPETGTIRIKADTTGEFTRTTYTGRTFGSGFITFTGCVGAPTAAANNDVYISYIDKQALATTETVTVVYDSDRAVHLLVRNGFSNSDSPIKPFTTVGTIGIAGGSSQVIRISDS